MATLPSFLRRAVAGPKPGPVPVPEPYDPFRLRALPHEDVYFFSKKIMNERVEREPDPREGRICRSAVGGACAVLAMLGVLFAPNVANRLAGYRLEELRAEQTRLLEERRVLDLGLAQALSQQNLDRLAQERGLVVPAPGQVVPLQPRDEGSVAMVRR